MSDTERTLLNECIAYSVNLMDVKLKFVDTNFRELEMLRCSAKKIWNLVTELTQKALEDGFESRIGKMGVFKLKITFR